MLWEQQKIMTVHQYISSTICKALIQSPESLHKYTVSPHSLPACFLFHFIYVPSYRFLAPEGRGETLFHLSVFCTLYIDVMTIKIFTAETQIFMKRHGTCVAQVSGSYHGAVKVNCKWKHAGEHSYGYPEPWPWIWANVNDYLLDHKHPKVFHSIVFLSVRIGMYDSNIYSQLFL